MNKYRRFARVCESRAQLTAILAADWRIGALKGGCPKAVSDYPLVIRSGSQQVQSCAPPLGLRLTSTGSGWHIILFARGCMRKIKITFAFSLLLLSLVSWAQSDTPLRQTTLRNLTLSGDPQISAAEQRQIASEVESYRVSANPLDGISERVRYVFQRRGYFKAWAAPPAVTVVSSSSAGETVDVAIAVNPGEQYRLKEISFSGNRVFTASELRQTFSTGDGEIFDTEKIRRGLELLRKLYASQGYVNATPVPETEADDAARTVALRVDVDEGGVFRVGSLVLDGVEPVPGAGARLMQSWKSYQGRVYSEELIDSFIRENAAYLPPNAAAWQLSEIRQDSTLHQLNFRLELGDGSEKSR